MIKCNKALCVLLSVVLLLVVAGCKADVTVTVNSSTPSSANDSSSSPSSSTPSSSNPSSSNPSSSVPGWGGDDYTVKDPFFNEGNQNTEYPGIGQNPNDTHTVDWPGPKGYVIVVPKNNKSAAASAETLKEYFMEVNGVELKIVDDSTAPADKEIIIGKTNRPESIKNLKDSQMQVLISGKKLVFGGGHDVTVDKAVRHFAKNAPNYQHTYTFLQSTDFTSTKNGGYKFVWGDEFENSKLDLTKWSTLGPKMGDGKIFAMGNTEDVISIKDGALCLTAYKDEQGKYHIPNSVHSEKTMNFLYGYVEIRAKIPLNVGCFASFWTRSVSDSGIIKGKFDNLFAEVDIFEVLQKKGGQYLAGNILKIPTKDSAKYWCTAAMPHAQSQPHLDNNFHLIAYEWTPTEMKFYYDGNLYARFDLTGDWVDGPVLGKGKPGWSVKYSPKTQDTYFDTSGTGMDCFREAQYLIFNHHLHHEDAFKASTSVTKNENFKSEDYLIDYVRVYQLDGQELYTK